MTILYNIIFLLFSIVYLPYLLFTGRYHKDIWQRFGLYPKDIIDGLKDRGVIWVHAVSVGEVMAARLLCEFILKKYPQDKLVISTITKTGNNIAKKLFKDKAAILYLPVDISHVINKVLDRIKPKLFVIIETEIWPNLIMALHKRKIPVVLANGRISPRSYSRYMKIRFLLKGILNKITLFCMQDKEYAERIKNMGAPGDRIAVTGNMKFDAADRATISGNLDTDAIRYDLDLKDKQPLFIAGSTHNPEERIVLKLYKNLLKSSPDLKLLIAPRHIERVSEIEQTVRRFNFMPVRTSNLTLYKQRAAGEEISVLILDTMGRLGQLFSVATVVFMGGSLMRKGGQNILEPAIFSKPIVFGPHMFNFKDITEAFVNKGAACMVKDENELSKTLSLLLRDYNRREELGNLARSLVEENKGATQRNMQEIEKILERR